jgi:hypothetical protein
MDEMMLFGESESATSPPAKPRRWPMLLAAVLGVAMIPMGFYCTEKMNQLGNAAIPPKSFASKPSHLRRMQVHSQVQSLQVVEENDEPEQIWGTWVMNYYGPRYLQINPDHTARLVSFPDMLAQMVLGTKRLDINCNWTRDGNRIHFKMADGTPENAFNYVLKTWGNTLPYEFVSVSPETLTFKDLSDGKMDVWSRTDSIPALHLMTDKPSES